MRVLEIRGACHSSGCLPRRRHNERWLLYSVLCRRTRISTPTRSMMKQTSAPRSAITSSFLAGVSYTETLNPLFTKTNDKAFIFCHCHNYYRRIHGCSLILPSRFLRQGYERVKVWGKLFRGDICTSVVPYEERKSLLCLYVNILLKIHNFLGFKKRVVYS
ncbi:hypothetical protein Hanom_Chr08g00758681 [Helianthus anomalus]